MAPVRQVEVLPKETRRDWKMYTAQAHMPDGSPREPKNFPPPARLLHGSRAAAAAAAIVDPEEAMVVELTGQVLSERLPDTDRGLLCSSTTAGEAGVDSNPATKHRAGTTGDSKGAAGEDGDGSPDAVGD